MLYRFFLNKYAKELANATFFVHIFFNVTFVAEAIGSRVSCFLRSLILNKQSKKQYLLWSVGLVVFLPLALVRSW